MMEWYWYGQSKHLKKKNHSQYHFAENKSHDLARNRKLAFRMCGLGIISCAMARPNRRNLNYIQKRSFLQRRQHIHSLL
jgi:hypothetical protein